MSTAPASGDAVSTHPAGADGVNTDAAGAAGPAAPAGAAGGAGYQWEPSDSEVAATYGLDPSRVVRFDTNTSPRTPPALRGWVEAAASDGRLNEYPDATYARLTSAIAARIGIASGWITVGAGADEILDLAAKSCLRAGARAVVAAPSYGMYPVVTRQRGAVLVEVPRGSPDDGFPLDEDGLLRAAAGADLAWLCDPNNPTGTVEAPAILATLLERLAALPSGGPVVVVDEAYREFAGTSLVDEVWRFPRLVVVRTLSKAYGLAGVRVGYAVAQPALTARLSAVRPPGSISTLSALIASAALADPTFVAANVAQLAVERERFRTALLDAGWRVLPSVANFLLLDLGGPEASDAAAERLLRRGLVPRRFGAGPLRGFLRVTVRTPEQDEAFLSALGRSPGAGTRPGKEQAT
jgi:histidinol-phosphate aminotransferase